MRNSTIRLLAYVMIAVTVMVGGVNGYMSCDDDAGQMTLAQSDHAHSAAHAHNGAVANADDSGPISNDNQDQSCPDAHVQCCISHAVAPCSATLAVLQDFKKARFALTSAIPAGNISYPLLRPPRANA